MSERWDNHFLILAIEHARMSKDPLTKVGAVIVGLDREIVSTGFNGFPRGIADTPERLENRDIKLRLIVHAEMNAILNAARIGARLKGLTLFLAATDESGEVWGGPPCTRCAVEIIQSGLAEVVSRPVKAVSSRWHEDIAFAGTLLVEAGIKYREVALNALPPRPLTVSKREMV
jgi:dCMP deaminase